MPACGSQIGDFRGIKRAKGKTLLIYLFSVILATSFFQFDSETKQCCIFFSCLSAKGKLSKSDIYSEDHHNRLSIRILMYIEHNFFLVEKISKVNQVIQVTLAKDNS